VWRVHVDLAGFRLRCVCGAWVPIPVAAAPPQLDAGAAALVKDERGTQLTRIREAHFASLAKAPPPGSLADAPVDVQRRWNDRTLVDLTMMMAAFFMPVLVVTFAAPVSMRAVLMPVASLVSSLGILLIGLFSPGYMFGGVKSTRSVFFLEAFAVAVGGAALAILYSHLAFKLMRDDQSEFSAMRSELGIALTLFVVAVCPAIFEELAFRGLVHGRLQAIFGAVQGRLITAAAFALAHGLTPALPIHAALGFYLGWLRDRSASLLPGMLTHFVYNGLIVVFMG
jgi:membrane protease YdiL (CAAX protease family)